MSNNPNPAPQSVTEFIGRALDSGYVQATKSTYDAVVRDYRTGALPETLAALEKRARELEAQGDVFSAHDPYMRAARADFNAYIDKLKSRLAIAVDESQAAGVVTAEQLTPQLAGFGLPAQQASMIAGQWNRPNPTAVMRSIGYANSENVQESLLRFGDFLDQRFLEVFTAGIVAGNNPRQIARDLIAFAEGMPRAYAESLTRSTFLTSYRDANVIQMVANADIIEGHIRIAALDDRTCLSCIALHGTFLQVNERVNDHRLGRCTSIPIIQNRPRNVRTGEEWLKSLPEEQQRNLRPFKQTPAKYDAWKAGAVQLQDFVHPDTDPVFGDVITEASLSGILGEKAKDFYKARK